MNMTESVEMDKEAREVGLALVQVIRDTKKALADNWDPASDIPTIIGSAVANFATKIADFQALPEMAKTNTAEFIKAWLITGADIAAVLMEK